MRQKRRGPARSVSSMRFASPGLNGFIAIMACVSRRTKNRVKAVATANTSCAIIHSMVREIGVIFASLQTAASVKNTPASDV